MSDASPWFKFYPAQFFADIVGMNAEEIGKYMIMISRAWVNCDFDQMTSSQIEQYHGMMNANNNRSEKLKARWEFRAKLDSPLIDVYKTTIGRPIDEGSATIDTHLMLSSLNSSSKRKNNNTYSAESLPMRIAISMNNLQKEEHGDTWKDRTEAHLQGWAGDIDKMHRIDKVPYSMIWGWYVACVEDDFWKQNIQSPSKLREQLNDNKLLRLKDKADENAYTIYDEEENAQGS